MADFNALLGNGNGVVAIFHTFQTGGELYTTGYKEQLEATANMDLANAKSESAKSQGIYDNTPDRRPFIEKQIRSLITKIASVYTFRKRFFFNQTLSAEAVLDYILAGDMIGFINHVDTQEMLSNNGGEDLIDAILGGTPTP